MSAETVLRNCPSNETVVVLDHAKIDTRSFPNWSMAFVGENEPDAEKFRRLGAESGFDPGNLTAENIFQTLHRLVREEEFT